MALTKEQLYEALVNGGGVTKEEFSRAAELRESQEGVDAGLVSLGLLTESQIGQLIADWYGVQHIDLEQTKPQEEVIDLIPEGFARNKVLLPISSSETIVRIAVTNPNDVLLRALLEKYLRKDIDFLYATSREIHTHLSIYQKDPKQAFNEIVATRVENDSWVIDLVNAFFNYAYRSRASDIHIEPEEEYTVIRFRVDGILSDIVELPKDAHEPIVTRLKVLAKLATDEHRAAQDGRISYRNEYHETIDIRLSIVPTTNGEKSVMRLLSEQAQQFSLRDLGMNERDFNIFKEAIKRPWGMILVTGPTGSGKTTSLYAALKRLNRREVNIATIEDPVEFGIGGINQIQVNTKTNLTFSKGLRSIVRQDPDIIMVGEIRDGETAAIGINAAMTGHLVLSTLHTNNAATAFPRIKDMGVEDFLVSSTVILVIAQRLVRKVCLNCIASVKLSDKEITLIKRMPHIEKHLKKITHKKKLSDIRVFKGNGCPVCQHTGYKGRSGIFEALTVTDEIREAVMRNDNADQIETLAIKNGMETMMEDGIQKVIMGITTLEEVLRVTQE